MCADVLTNIGFNVTLVCNVREFYKFFKKNPLHCTKKTCLLQPKIPEKKNEADIVTTSILASTESSKVPTPSTLAPTTSTASPVIQPKNNLTVTWRRLKDDTSLSINE